MYMYSVFCGFLFNMTKIMSMFQLYLCAQIMTNYILLQFHILSCLIIFRAW